MFCCCPKDPNTHPENSNQKAKGAGQPDSTAVKRAATSSDQQSPTADKSPITQQPASGTSSNSIQISSHTTTANKSPITQHPPSTTNPPAKTLIVSNSKKPESHSPQSVDLSNIQVKVSGVESPSQILENSSVKVESQIKDNSNFLQGSKTVISNIMSNDLLKSINLEVDKLEKSVDETEKKSQWEAKSSVNKLANQLKALTSQVLASAKGPGNMADKALQGVVSRLEAVASRLEDLASKSGGTQSAGGDSDSISPFVAAFDDVRSGVLAKFLSLSSNIGGDVQKQAGLVKDAFDSQRSFLVVASKSKQPDQNTLGELLKVSAAKLQAIQDFRENNRKSDLFNHLSAISESIAALGWVAVTPAPGPFVKEMADAGTFYTNRVLKDFKEKDPKHVEWCRSWLQTLTELQAYIKQFHTTGLTWNPKGGDAKSVQSNIGGGASAPPPPCGGPPPPPPPGPPPPPDTSSSKADNDGEGRAALFADLSKGADVTKGLKKVTDDMKTHKNPSLRQGPAPFKPAAAPKPNASPKPVPKNQAAPSHPPKIELEGKKWVVEYHKNNKNIVLDKVDIKQSVYVYKCEGSVIKINGKINSIVVDSCKKTGVVFDDVLASLEFVNCQSMQAQVTGKLPTLSIDKTDGCMMYLSNDSLGVEIVTAKSSEMNILVPVGNGDYKEFALPEQFKTTYNGKTIVTSPTDIV